MIIPEPRPELIINYCPGLDLRFIFVELVDYGGAARQDYQFEMRFRCRTGGSTFAYSANNLYFGLDGFVRFAQELQGLQQGLRQEAGLNDPGEMVVLRLEKQGNQLLAEFDVRECVPPSKAELHLVLEVDYDLFVNKLKREVDRFIDEIRQFERSVPE